MQENIYYRFSSCKNFTKLPFNGDSLPLWELRSEIINGNKMDSTDFDLLFYDEDTLITDDYYIVHKNSMMVVKRVPLWIGKILRKGETVKAVSIITNEPEDSNISQINANTKKIVGDSVNNHDSSNYFCKGCNKKKGEHAIGCRFKSDSNSEQSKIMKPRGIPKDYIKHIDTDTGMKKGLLATSKGFVKIEPQIKKLKYNNIYENIPSYLKCKICNSLFFDPMLCECKHTYCADCIDSEKMCCGKKIQIIGINEEIKRKLDNFFNKNMK